jgi:methionine-gamma-lyase
MTEEPRPGLRTRAIHSPPGRHGAGVPLVGPIVPAATFAFETAAEFARVMTEEEYGFLYARLRNPTVEELNGVLASLESAEAAQAFSSGMAAISAALLTNLEAGDTLLCARQLYGNTYSFIEKHLTRIGVDVVHLDVTDVAAWERPARVLYVETIANPAVPVADLRALAERKGDAVLIVDNTFASPVLCRPLELGADIVCESGTKYLNGHHDVTAGVLAGSVEAVSRARDHLIDVGSVLDPFPAFLLRRGLKTLALRMECASRNAGALARFLEGHEKVSRVHYVGLPSYEHYELARRQLDDSGGMLAFDVGPRESGEQLMDALELCARATSLGGVDTMVSHAASTTHRQFSAEQLAAAGISEGLLRVSVGCEDGDDIVADFEQALGHLGRL